MTRLMVITALLGMTLVLANVNDVSAKGTKGSSNNSKNFKVSPKSFHVHHGFDHRLWSSWYWDAQYSCYFYYSSADACYFYFYAPANCFYPVSAIVQYRPVVVAYQTPTSPGVAPMPIPTQTTTQGPVTQGTPGTPMPTTTAGPTTSTPDSVVSGGESVNPLAPVGGVVPPMLPKAQ